MTTRNLSATVKRASLPKCWVKEGEKYILTGRGGNPIRQNLPYVFIQFEQVLKDLDIPYEVNQLPDRKHFGRFYSICSFWNPDLYEVETLCLPVYRQVQSTKDLFVNTGEVHKGSTFSRDMISKAIETQKVVRTAVEEQKAFRQAVKECQRANQKHTPALTKVDEEFLKKALDGKSAKVVKIANSNVDDVVDFGDIKIIPAYYSDGTKNGYYGIFDMAKLNYVSVIKVVVPKGEAQKVCGARKQNQQYWEYCCGKGIKVISDKG